MSKLSQMSAGKKAALITSAAAVGGTAICFAAANMLYSFALVPDTPFNMQKMMMKQLEGDTAKVSSDKNISTQKYSGYGGDENTKKWFNENKTDVFVTSEDGLKLHGLVFKNSGKAAASKYILACHGFSGKAADMKSAVKHLYDMGYSVIAVDARAHGESEGKVRGMGCPERRDVIKWVEYINQKDPDAKIALYGVSMGAATVLSASGEADLPDNVFAVVEDCGYTSIWDEFSVQMKNMFHLPTFPLLNAASVVTKVRAGYDFHRSSALEQVKKSKTPTLFIHGDSDNFVPFGMLDTLYNAASCEKQKLAVKGADHALSSITDPDLYWNTVHSFLNQHQ
ncbi:MAG: alpha/beta hydrolase [Acutalibacteraceae bacterium]